MHGVNRELKTDHWIALCTMIIACLSAANMIWAYSPAENAQVVGRTRSSASFVDVTSKLGIHFKQEASPTSRKYLLETMGSGVALFDYDNDGRLDIFLGNGAEIDDPMPPGRFPRKPPPNIGIAYFIRKRTGLSWMLPKRLA